MMRKMEVMMSYMLTPMQLEYLDSKCRYQNVDPEMKSIEHFGKEEMKKLRSLKRANSKDRIVE